MECDICVAVGRTSRADEVVAAALHSSARALRRLCRATDAASIGPMSVTAPATSSRFELRHALGAGGMGIVHLAWDRERQMEIALKSLQGADPTNLARLKREFRALAQLAHPNLVALYELFAEDGSWFFTMEPVAGVRFDAWCASTPRLDAPDLYLTTRVQLNAAKQRGQLALPAEPATPRLPAPIADLDRLRRATRGLLAGIEALHRAGMVHCDLKPSNVLVEPDGRAVVLDFGLVKERPRGSDERATAVEGTPEYVAPEVVAGEAPTPASDYYQIGVMLFQAVVGEPPFHDAYFATTLLAKCEVDAPRLSERADGVPPELDVLVAALLERDPSRRAGADRIRAWTEGSPSRDLRRLIAEPPFVGREVEQAALERALEAVTAGRPRTVLVGGPSGIGKSALLRRFADRVERAGEAIVLAGRCYQREQVPFKALDGVVDAMAARLSRLSGTELSQILPEQGGDALVRVFPVLRAVEQLDAMAPPELAPSDAPGETLTRAAEAARELFRRWSERTPILIVIDDLQWGDADSAAFIARMIDPRSRTRLLTLATARSDADTPVIEAMRTLAPERFSEITLGPLDAAEGEALARSVLGGDGTASAERARTIAKDAAGVPFFVTELARHANRAPGAEVHGVDDAITARVADVPAAPRALLEASALAGVPLPASLLMRAAKLEGDPLPHVRLLTARSLLRSAGGNSDAVEPYHDRIRERLASGLSDAHRTELHRRLGDQLAEAPWAEPEAVAHHLSRAGEGLRALPFQLRAAERASQALAFDRAVALYDEAREMCQDERQQDLLSIALAEALVLAGRAQKAAPLFLSCAERATGPERARLERRAAEEWLKCGNVDEGVAVLRRVLADVELRYPDAQLEALGRALVRILRIRRLDGTFTERAEADVPPKVLARVDAARAAGVGLMMIDPLRGYGFLARYLLDAVAAGEPRRVSAGLSLNAVTLCRSGEKGYPLAKRWLDRAREIAARLEDPYLRGLADACEAGASVTTGRWARGAELGLSAPSLLRSTGTPATWERTASVSLGRTSLFAMGRIADLRAHTMRHLRDADDVGDRFAATYARVHGWALAAADDDPTRGRAELHEALAQWSRLGFHAMHFWRLYGELMFDLYEDVPEKGRERLAAARPALKKSRILAMQFYDAFLSATEAAIELRLAERGEDRAAATERASAIAKHLKGMGRPYTEAICTLISARLTRIEGGDATRSIEAASTAFERADMALHAAAASALGARWVGGSSARDAAIAACTAQGIAGPERWLQMLVGPI